MLRCRSCTATLAFLQFGCHFDQKLRCSKRKTAMQHWKSCVAAKWRFPATLSLGFQAPTFRHPRLGPADCKGHASRSREFIGVLEGGCLGRGLVCFDTGSNENHWRCGNHPHPLIHEETQTKTQTTKNLNRQNSKVLYICREKETQTMVRVSSPAKLRPWSELTAKNGDGGGSWVGETTATTRTTFWRAPPFQPPFLGTEKKG